MPRIRIALIGKCESCQHYTTIWQDSAATNDPHALDLLESRVPKTMHAICEKCDRVCDAVATFFDGERTDPWRSPKQFETDEGPCAGPLPPKPWQQNN